MLFILYSVPIALIYLLISMVKDKNLIKNMYIKIALATLLPFIIFALFNIPFMGNEWGDSYFVNIRSLVLRIHYWIAVSYFSLYYYLWTKKKMIFRLLIIPICMVQIILFIIFLPFSQFVWTAI